MHSLNAFVSFVYQALLSSVEVHTDDGQTKCHGSVLNHSAQEKKPSKDLIKSFQNQFWSPSNYDFPQRTVSKGGSNRCIDDGNRTMTTTPTMAISASYGRYAHHRPSSDDAHAWTRHHPTTVCPRWWTSAASTSINQRQATSKILTLRRLQQCIK